VEVLCAVRGIPVQNMETIDKLGTANSGEENKPPGVDDCRAGLAWLLGAQLGRGDPTTRPAPMPPGLLYIILFKVRYWVLEYPVPVCQRQ